MLDIQTLMRATGNEFASIAEDGVAAGDISSFIGTGSYALNALLSADIHGGFASNKIMMIAAPPSTGKCMRGSEVIDVYFENEEDLEKFLAL